MRVGRDTEKEGKGEAGERAKPWKESGSFGGFMRLNRVGFFLVCCRLLRGQEAGVQHGPVRGDLADRGDHPPVEPQPLQRQWRHGRGFLMIPRVSASACV